MLDIHIFGGEVAKGFRDGKGKREGSGCSAGGVGTSGLGDQTVEVGVEEEEGTVAMSDRTQYSAVSTSLDSTTRN